MEKNLDPAGELQDLAPLSTPIFSDRQRYILEKLESHKLLAQPENFGTLYVSALEVMYTPIKIKANLSAHCLREILEKLPEAIAGMSATIPQDQRDALHKIRETWTTVIAHSKWQSLVWEEQTIDSNLGDFLKNFDVFHKSGAMKKGPSRRDLKKTLIQFLHKNHPEMSPGFIDTMITRWNKVEVYMKKVAHIGTTTSKEFDENLLKFEDLLIDLFKQPVLENILDIDAIIAEGERK